MLFVHPFAKNNEAVFKTIEKDAFVLGGPALEHSKLRFARAARQVVAPGLQAQLARFVEAESGVGPVHLFFDDEVLSGQLPVRCLVASVVAFLQARALKMGRAWVFYHPFIKCLTHVRSSFL